MPRIMSYVFLDLETTSIPRLEFNKTRITELSLVVVKRRHLLDRTSERLPRVLPKLTMCFNPGRMINPGATEASGLDNYLLEYETRFNINVFNAINSFIECQEKPVCLIAENGHNFDFPILKNHFEKLNVSLVDDIMCADSLHALYDILKENGNDVVPLHQPVEANGTLGVESEIVALPDDKLNDENKMDFDVIIIDDDNEVIEIPDTLDEKLQAESADKHKEATSPLSLQSHNEVTPKKQVSQNMVTPKGLNQVRRKLFWGTDDKPKESHKLKAIYQRVLGRPGIDAHRAENDCIMLAEVSVASGIKFVEWIDKNHCKFSEVQAMTLGVPLGQ